jgi:hypothetical protein
MIGVLAAVLVAGGLVAYFGILFFLLDWAIDDGFLGGIAVAVWITGGLAFVIYCSVSSESEADAKGPCVREETRYVLVGKVMTPYTYCAERGEWSDPKR